MPGFKTHAFGGTVLFGILVFAGVLYPCYSIPQLFVWFICTLLGSLFPDIDTKSRGQKLFYGLLAAVLIILALKHAYAALTSIALIAFLPLLTDHRGLFHKWWFLFLVIGGSTCGLLFLFPHAYSAILSSAGFFAVGVASHLLLDMVVSRLF